MCTSISRSACLVLLGLFLTTTVCLAADLEQWEAGKELVDQSTELDEEHSGLVPWQGAVVEDRDLEVIVKPFIDRGVKFVWVFSQCFGAGFFDELDKLKGTQSGVSASGYNQTSFYQRLRPEGNGVNFSTAYIEAMRSRSKAKDLALAAAANDPWGPADKPTPPRSPAEKEDIEQPFYFSTGHKADKLSLNLRTGDDKDGLAILWSGTPRFPHDTVEINQLIHQLLDFGFKRQNIFVLYGRGKYSPTGHLIGKTVNDLLRDVNEKAGKARQLRIATEKQLRGVLGTLVRPNSPKLVFFFANDHGFNTGPGIVSREGADTFPIDAPPGRSEDIGDEDEDLDGGPIT